MHEEPQTFSWALPLFQALRGAFLCLLAALFLSTAPASAALLSREEPPSVIPLGKAVGIKMFSDGVIVVGLSQLEGPQGRTTPARDCGLRQGDIITHINNTQVDTIEQVRSVLQDLEGEPMSIRAMRAGKLIQLTGQAAACNDGTYKLGAWIRDSMAGIGTMTFYDPATGTFGALGHSVNDVDTSLLLPLESGAILPASVSDVKKGKAKDPGELHGTFRTDHDLGELYANTPSGVFGTLSDLSMVQGLPSLPVAARKELHTGPATILSNIRGNTVEEYAVEITRVYPQGSHDTRELMLKVTDPRLLEATGGIVQGMSGSPILQDGKVAGAVTHVWVSL